MQQQVVPLPPPPLMPLPLPIPNLNAASASASVPPSASQSQGFSTYIPYAREQRAPSTRRQGLGPSGYMTSSTGFNRSQPRTSSSLNPSTVRPQKMPQTHPVTLSKQPLPPYFPISTSQAYMTTYPSRLRLGLTNLMQPITANGAVVAASLAATAAASKDRENETRKAYSATAKMDSANVLGKRQRSQVNYRERVDIPEPPSSSEDEEGDEGQGEANNEAEEDSKLSRDARAAKRSGIPATASAISSRDSSAPPGSNARNGDERARSKEQDVGGGGRSWLGQDPPGDLVLVQPARRHILPYVSVHVKAVSNWNGS